MNPSASTLGLLTADLERLLARPLIPLDIEAQRRVVAGCNVLVTGAGGSVGAELVRSVARAGARRIVMLDLSEPALFWIDDTVRQLAASEFPDLAYRSVLGSVSDHDSLEMLLADERPDLVLHAAACKHVDLVERNPLTGLQTNVVGTSHLLRAAGAAGVECVLLVSTDKAVQPASLMGATKRAAEHLVRAHAAPGRRYASVRFGNVLGSSGSVLQVFARRLAEGRPLEIRHPDASRYFLAGVEAAGLLVTAAGLAEEGDLLLLDTGPRRRIQSLADALIAMLGATLPADRLPSPPMRITSLRPGERVHERLSAGEPLVRTGHPAIVRLAEPARQPQEILALAEDLADACARHDARAAIGVLRRLVPEYRPCASSV